MNVTDHCGCELQNIYDEQQIQGRKVIDLLNRFAECKSEHLFQVYTIQIIIVAGIFSEVS